MASNLRWAGSPFFWALLSAIFFGAAISRITRLSSRAPDAERARTMKWTVASISASVSVLLALAGLFISGPEKILDLRILYLFGGTVIVSALALRFKRSCGLPVLLVVMLSVFFFIIALSHWEEYESGEAVARFRVLSKREDRLSIEYLADEQESFFFELAGHKIRPVISLIEAEDYYFFAYRPRGYRVLQFDGLSSDQELDTYPVAIDTKTASISKAFGGLDTWIAYLPGWKIERVELDPIDPKELFSYGVIFGGTEEAPRLEMIK